MPGPKATVRTSRPDTGTTDKKAAARIAERVRAYENAKKIGPPTSVATSMHNKPGSQNRKKRL